MQALAVTGLPTSPAAAAAAFYAEHQPGIAAALHAGAASLTLVFDPADHTHTAWRLAAVQTLAREHAPARINAVAGGSAAAQAAALAYLAAAAGLTGQYLPLDDAGAGCVVTVP